MVQYGLGLIVGRVGRREIAGALLLGHAPQKTIASRPGRGLDAVGRDGELAGLHRPTSHTSPSELAKSTTNRASASDSASRRPWLK